MVRPPERAGPAPPELHRAPFFQRLSIRARSFRVNVAKGRCLGNGVARALCLTVAVPGTARTAPGIDSQRRWRYAAKRRITTEAFVPPKPNEFDSTVSIWRFCALCATRSMAVSTEGLSRLRVGGATLSRMASTE